MKDFSEQDKVIPTTISKKFKGQSTVPDKASQKDGVDGDLVKQRLVTTEAR